MPLSFHLKRREVARSGAEEGEGEVSKSRGVKAGLGSRAARGEEGAIVPVSFASRWT